MGVSVDQKAGRQQGEGRGGPDPPCVPSDFEAGCNGAVLGAMAGCQRALLGQSQAALTWPRTKLLG